MDFDINAITNHTYLADGGSQRNRHDLRDNLSDGLGLGLGGGGGQAQGDAGLRSLGNRRTVGDGQSGSGDSSSDSRGAHAVAAAGAGVGLGVGADVSRVRGNTSVGDLDASLAETGASLGQEVLDREGNTALVGHRGSGDGGEEGVGLGRRGLIIVCLGLSDSDGEVVSLGSENAADSREASLRGSDARGVGLRRRVKVAGGEDVGDIKGLHCGDRGREVAGRRRDGRAHESRAVFLGVQTGDASLASRRVTGIGCACQAGLGLDA
ncbi:hypothetical protein PG990_013197 [Apiospora arundinis]